MKLTEIWKKQMISVLKSSFKDSIDENLLNKYLDAKIAESKPQEIILKLRNVYENTLSELPADTILETIIKNKYIVGGNGTYALNQKEYMSPVSKELIRMKKLRSEYKNLMKEAISNGDKEGEILYGNLQTHVKQSTNAYYGIQLQPGSFLYNPDTASLITIQAREMISEMMWTLERMLEGNPQFLSFGEFMNFLNSTIRNSKELAPIDFQPSKPDLTINLEKVLKMIPKYVDFYPKIKSFYENFISNLSEEEVRKLYYINNLEDFIFKNKSILNLIVDMMNIPISYRVPGTIKIQKDSKKEDIDNIEKFNSKLTQFTNLVLEYVVSPLSNYKRIDKYLTRYRKSIVISDTDSVMINLGNWTEKIGELTGIITDPFINEENSFKITNIFSHLCTQVTSQSCQNFCAMSNVPEEYRYLAEMKNEFLFERMISYASSKKAYAALKRLKEGIQINEIEWKGLKFVGSGLSPIVRDITRDFIENKILRNPKINLSNILIEVRSIENKLKESLKNGEMTLGKSVVFSGSTYKNIYTNAAGRSCLIWNILYPDNPINDGEYAHMFDTTFSLPEDIERLSKSFPEEYSFIKENIYNNPTYPQLAKYGLNYISIPKDSNINDIPLWIRSIMDIDGMVNKHMQPISSLLPSLQGLIRSRISSTKFIHTNIIQL